MHKLSWLLLTMALSLLWLFLLLLFLSSTFLSASFSCSYFTNWFVSRRETQRFLNLTSFDEYILILQEAIRWLDYWLVKPSEYNLQCQVILATHWQHGISSNPGGQETLAKNSEGAKAKALLSNGKDSACNLVMAAGLCRRLDVTCRQLFWKYLVSLEISAIFRPLPSFVASSFGFGASFEVSAEMVSRHTPGSIHLRRARRSLPLMRWPSRPRKSHAAKCNSSFGFVGGKNARWENPQDSGHHIYLIITYNNMSKNAQPLRGSMILEASAKTWDSFRPASQPIRPVEGESWPFFIAGTGQSALLEFTSIAILSEMVCTRSRLTHVAVFYGMPFLWYGTTHHPNMDTETSPE